MVLLFTVLDMGTSLRTPLASVYSYLMEEISLAPRNQGSSSTPLLLGFSVARETMGVATSAAWGTVITSALGVTFFLAAAPEMLRSISQLNVSFLPSRL